MNLRVRNKLIEIAHKKQIITYQELSDSCGLDFDMYNNPSDRLAIGDILDEIGTYEYNAKRPLITSVVITKNGKEGDGYFKLCERLGLTSNWELLKKDDIFSVQQIASCHTFWSNPTNYRDYK